MGLIFENKNQSFIEYSVEHEFNHVPKNRWKHSPCKKQGDGKQFCHEHFLPTST